MTALLTFVFNPRVFIVLLVIALLIVLAAPADTSNSHAVSKHGARGGTISDGCNSGNFLLQMYNHATGHCARIYQDDQGFGVQIIDNLNSEITAFPKESAKTIGDVIKYLFRGGYR